MGTAGSEHIQALPVAIEAMGGDLGCSVAVAGAVKAWHQFKIPTVLVGKEEEIKRELEKLDARALPGVSVVHAEQIVHMDDSPSAAIRKKPRSSLRIAFKLVKEGKASSVLSAGNTGAMMATGMFEWGVIKGLNRPAIATLIPKVEAGKVTVLIDSGANTECNSKQLVRFALMGDVYARELLGMSSPRISVLSNGEEKSKGSDLTRSTAMMLERVESLNFVGYSEGSDFARDSTDVVVCDGFVGNVVLKAMEGSMRLIVESLRAHSTENVRTRLGLFLTKPLLRRLFKEKFHPSTYGGAPLLGLQHVAVVCHGSSNARAFKNAIRVAHQSVEAGLPRILERSLGSVEFLLDVD